MSPRMHSMFRLSPFQSITHGPNIPKALSRVISGSGNEMQELVLEPTNRVARHFSLGDEDLQRMVNRQPQIVSFLGNLTKLRLDITDVYTNTFRSGIVAKQLSYAHNLEHLFFEHPPLVRRDGTSIFCLGLGGCRFPKLRTFALASSDMKSDDLLSLILHSPKLQHLVLYRCTLSEYLWSQILETMKTDMHLQAIHMDDIWGGFEEHILLDDRYDDFDGEAEKFLSHDGLNPFDIESLRIHAIKWPTYSGRPPADRNVVEYYDRYFR